MTGRSRNRTGCSHRSANGAVAHDRQVVPVTDNDKIAPFDLSRNRNGLTPSVSVTIPCSSEARRAARRFRRIAPQFNKYPVHCTIRHFPHRIGPAIVPRRDAVRLAARNQVPPFQGRLHVSLTVAPWRNTLMFTERVNVVTEIRFELCLSRRCLWPSPGSSTSSPDSGR